LLRRLVVIALVLAGLAGGACKPRPAPGWTWVDVPGSACNDGTPTGYGVHTSASSQDLLVVLEGGGQCFDWETCFVIADLEVGPSGARDFAKHSKGFTGVLAWNDAANPYHDWNVVYVPYCTGDFHSGQNVTTYTSPAGEKRTFRHVGRTNLDLYLPRWKAAFPRVSRLVVSGMSAGGYGATLEYGTIRDALAPRASHLVDDSGPMLPADAIPQHDRAAMVDAWKLDLVLDPACGGKACREDFSLLPSKLAERYPNDRMALVSAIRDDDITRNWHLTPDRFEGALTAHAQALDKTERFRTFLFPGTTHMTLRHPERFSANGEPLATWLREQVDDAPGWASRHP
jgi:hypothetical protein